MARGTSGTILLAEERRNGIEEILRVQNRILVAEMAKQMKISEVTIRKDLEVLERRGVLKRVHRGAIRVSNPTVIDLDLVEKEHIHSREKDKIALKAAELIRDGEAIILDSGSTTTAIARALKARSGLTIITNAVNIAWELTASKNQVILIGGIVRENSFSLVGPLSEEAMRNLSADKLFLGVDGIHFEFGLTTPNLQEATINRMMLHGATDVFVVADSSKIGRRSLGVIAEVTAAHHLITDDHITPADREKLRELGIDVIIA